MKRSASTLIEIIFYFAILGILLLAAMTFALQILSVNRLSQNSYELQSAHDAAVYYLSTSINRADAVNVEASTFDDDNGVLSLSMTDVSLSPTVFYLSDGDFLMQRGAEPAIQINSDDVQFSNLRFNHIDVNKAPDQIVVDAFLQPANTIISNLQLSSTLHVSLSLRQ